MGGIEKLTVCSPVQGMCSGRPNLCAGDVSHDDRDLTHSPPPLGFMFVKGWTRSVAAMTVLCCAWENPEFLQARDFHFITYYCCGLVVYSGDAIAHEAALA